MLPSSHLLVLSQPDFLHSQLDEVMRQSRPAAAVRARRFWSRAFAA